MPEHRSQTAELLEEVHAFVARMSEFENAFGACRAIMKYGTAFRPRETEIDWLRLGQPRDCFNNATRYAAVREDVLYAEGYALESGLPIPVHHAWLVDRNGQVIDPTWQDTKDHVYFGIPFKREFVRDHLARTNGQAGILVNLHLIRGSRRRAEDVEQVILSGIAQLA